MATWFRKYARDLPWRRTRDPYAIAVSEVMLQQTTAVAVIPYFERWMAQFPDVRSLAAADEEGVLALWQGLGYYSRARNLLQAAKEIVSKHHGQFPGDIRHLRALPGFGPYTAGAVAAFAFDRPEVVIDANIQRVLARLADIREAVDTAVGQERLRAVAVDLLPRHRGGRIHVGALMELGAVICRPHKPLCGMCPIREFCRTTTPESLPVKKPRAMMTSESDRRSLIIQKGRVALIPSPGPRWRGLWLLPEARPDDESLFLIKYTITRHRVTLDVARGFHPPQGAQFFKIEAPPPMPSPHAKALARVRSEGALSLANPEATSP